VFWVIGLVQRERIEFLLSEYQDLIVEVFEVEDWYSVLTKEKGKDKIKRGFKGMVATEEIRQKYINKSVAHSKKRVQLIKSGIN
jgi:uncharacterized protein